MFRSISLIRRLYAGVLVMMFLLSVVWAAANTNTSVRFRIINSYSGSIALAVHSGTWLLDQYDVRWTNQYQAHLRVASDSDASYEVTGDVVGFPISSSGSGPYIHDYTIDLMSGTSHHISTLFMKDGEPLIPSPLHIMVDDVAPPLPGLQTSNNIVIADEVVLERSGIVDTGIGLSHYVVFVGSTPGLSSMVAIVTTGTAIQISGSLLPTGTLYRTVVAIDKLGNQSDYVIGYIHHGTSSTTPQFGGGGGSVGSDQTHDSSTTVPIYTPDDSGSYQPHSVTCKGGRVSHLRNCEEWDRFNLSFLSSTNKDHRTWDDFPVGITRLGTVRRTDPTTESSVDEESNNTSSFVNFVTPAAIGTSTTDSYDGTGIADGGLLFTMLSDISSTTHESAGLIERLFETYICERTNYCVESNYSNYICEYLNYCAEPDPDVYESTIRQYGENVVSRTQVFSWYVVVITMILMMMSGWFFVLGYHHHYVIRYLK